MFIDSLPRTFLLFPITRPRNLASTTKHIAAKESLVLMQDTLSDVITGLTNNPKFDKASLDYFATPAGGGQIGKTTATGATSLANAFYIMNQNYEVFKCLYNGEMKQIHLV